MRYGVQIVTHFGDTGKRSLEFLKTEMLEDKGRRTLQVDVENDGERWLRPFSYVEIFTEKGAAAGKVEGEPVAGDSPDRPPGSSLTSARFPPAATTPSSSSTIKMSRSSEPRSS